MLKQLKVLREAEIPRKNSVGHADSVEKIIGQLALLTPDLVRYQGHSATGRLRKEVVFEAPVTEILITPSLFRKFICTDGCTACCQKFTLDYIPSEIKKVSSAEGFSPRSVYVNGRRRVVLTNDQNQNPICDFLRVQRPGGGLGCFNYRYAPLSCISAPQLQFIQMRPGKTYVLKKPFGRAWAMTPTPQCQFVEFTSPQEFDDEIKMMLSILTRFHNWAKYFGIATQLQTVMQAIKKANHFQMEGAVSVWTSA
jgi:hypothetical protein